MTNIDSVVAFGKIFFIPTKESVPPLPEMNLLFLKEDERKDIFPWRAVCIDLEIDAVGNNMDEVWENLKDALTIYINMEKEAVGGSIINAAERIVNTAFTATKQKKEYIDLYRQAKLKYTMGIIKTEIMNNPIEEEKRRLERLETTEEPIRYSTRGHLRAA